MNPFDFVNSISYKKNNMMRDTENDDMVESGYNSFIVNKALSQHADMILHVNEVNVFHDTPNRAKYEFLLNSIRARKRGKGSWSKPTEDVELDAICEVYNCNKRVAESYRSLMSTSDMESIMNLVQKGGKE